eukprot:4004031-Prymnesium_polylepis.1
MRACPRGERGACARGVQRAQAASEPHRAVARRVPRGPLIVGSRALPERRVAAQLPLQRRALTLRLGELRLRLLYARALHVHIDHAATRPALQRSHPPLRRRRVLRMRLDESARMQQRDRASPLDQRTAQAVRGGGGGDAHGVARGEGACTPHVLRVPRPLRHRLRFHLCARMLQRRRLVVQLCAALAHAALDAHAPSLAVGGGARGRGVHHHRRARRPLALHLERLHRPPPRMQPRPHRLSRRRAQSAP